MVVEGAGCVTAGGGTLFAWCAGIASFAAGALLLTGFLTPLGGALAAFRIAAAGVSVVSICPERVFDTVTSIAFGAALAVGVAALGPGLFSVDARLFGRREIIIPPVSRMPD